jgi:hypothetical protein
VKDTGALWKAKGRCKRRKAKEQKVPELAFSADQGTLKPDKLTVALSVISVKAEVVPDLDAAAQATTGDTGDAGQADASQATEKGATREDVRNEPKAQGSVSTESVVKLQAAAVAARQLLTGTVEAFKKLREALNDQVPGDILPALTKLGERIKQNDDTAIEELKKLRKTIADLAASGASGKAQAHAHGERKALAPVESELENHEKVIAQLERQLAEAEKNRDAAQVAVNEFKPGSMRKQEIPAAKQKLQDAVDRAATSMQGLKTKITALNDKPILKDPAIPDLVKRYAAASKDVVALRQALARLDADSILVENGPAKQEIPDALNKAVAQHAKVSQAMQGQPAKIKALDEEWKKVAQEIGAATNAKIDAKALPELQKLTAAKAVETDLKAKDASSKVVQADFGGNFDAIAATCQKKIDDAKKALASLDDALKQSAAIVQRQEKFTQRAKQAGVTLATSQLGDVELQAMALKASLARLSQLDVAFLRFRPFG